MKIKKFIFKNKVYLYHSFETRPGLVGRPGARTGLGLRKNRKRQNSG